MMKNSGKTYKRICPVCGKEFIAKSTLKITCSNNCRATRAYHNKHKDAKHYIKNKTKEEKLKWQRDYLRNRYQTDEKFREYIKAKRRKRYKEKGV